MKATADLAKLIEQAGIGQHPIIPVASAVACSPFAQEAAQALSLIHTIAEPAILLKQLGGYQPPPVPQEEAIPLGTHRDPDFPVELSLSKMKHIAIIGGSYTGKNNIGYKLGEGILRHKKQFHCIAQKGDELNLVNLWTNSLYVPIQYDFWNELCPPIGPNPNAYWNALTEAFAIPKGIDVRTRPEFPLLLEQMWRSAPNPSWLDLCRGFRKKSKQADGREKHSTAASVIAPYAAWLQEKGSVQVGVDIRKDYQSIVYGYLGSGLENIEASMGIRLVREQFEALERGHSREPRVYILIPEAHLLFDGELEYARRGSLSYLSQFLTMSSSMGVYLIILLQNISKISQKALNSCESVIVTRQDSPSEAALCVARLGLGEESIQTLMSLQLGEAYVRQGDWERPVLTYIERVDLGEPLTREALDTRFSSDYERMRKNTTFAKPDAVVEAFDWADNDAEKEAGAKKAQRGKDRPPIELLEDYRILLEEILRNPKAWVRKHQENTGWGGYRFYRTLGALKQQGFIVETAAPATTCAHEIKILALTPAGQRFLRAYESGQ